MAKVEVVMPQMGESVMEGTVIQWSKAIGDTIAVDDTLLEIATDKVDTEVPSPEAGVLVQILAQEGETVQVGRPIAIIETDASAAASTPSAGASTPAASAPAPSAAAPAAAQSPAPAPAQTPVPAAPVSAPAPAAAAPVTGGQRIEVVMPQMGESVMEGTIIQWSKSIGDQVEVDETLLEIATDKVDTEVPSPDSGVLTEILAQAGDTIQVGAPIAVIVKGGAVGVQSTAQPAGSTQAVAPTVSTAPAGPAPTPAAAAQSPVPAVAAAMNGSAATSVPRTGANGRFYSPLVRSIAEKEGIPVETLDSIAGTGQQGRVTKNDILAFLASGATPTAGIGATSTATTGATPSTAQGPAPAAPPQPAAAPTPKAGAGLSRPGAPSPTTIHAGELQIRAPQQNVEIVKMDRMRKMIAEHMVRSKQTSAHVTTFSDVDVTNIVRWRERVKGTFEQRTGIKLTYTPIFVEAIIQAIREFPLINSSVVGEEIHIKKDINFGLAVALGQGGQGGLIVPVIKHAQEKNLIGLSEAIQELAVKARSKTLSPDDLVGGTVTLTNYGSVGNLMGTPIINQPQVAIIGTGVIEKRPVVVETDQGDVIAIRQRMYLSMSYDHRIIDGAHGGAFLNRIKQLLEAFDVNRAV